MTEAPLPRTGGARPWQYSQGMLVMAVGRAPTGSPWPPAERRARAHTDGADTRQRDRTPPGQADRQAESDGQTGGERRTDGQIGTDRRTDRRRGTDRQTDGETDRLRDGQTERRTD